MSKLYIVPTPIGNLEDITLRAIRILKETEMVYAEDTRVTKRLLNHLEIKKTVVKGAKYAFRVDSLCFVILSSNNRPVIFRYLPVSSFSFFNNLIKNTLSKTL